MREVVPESLSLTWLEAFAMNVVIALAILIIGWWFSNFVGRWVKRMAQRSHSIDLTIVPIAESVVVWTIRLLVLLAVLARFGVETASVIALIGAAGLAIGLALQNTLQNIAAGIMLLLLRPLRAGEFVSVVGKGDGTVDEVGLFLTRFVQVDGVQFTLPNSSIWGNPIINYSRNATRRMDITFGVRYGDDLDAAMATLLGTVEANANILEEPAPRVFVAEYRDSTIMVTARAWAESGVYWDTRFALLRDAPVALAQAGFKLPVPVRVVENVEGKNTSEAA